MQVCLYLTWVTSVFQLAQMPEETTLTEFPDMRLPSSMMTSTQPPKTGGPLRPGDSARTPEQEMWEGRHGGRAYLNSDGGLDATALPRICLCGVLWGLGGVVKVAIEAYSCGLCCGCVTWPRRVTDLWGRGICQDRVI